jgi:hypothetical protein
MLLLILLRVIDKLSMCHCQCVHFNFTAMVNASSLKALVATAICTPGPHLFFHPSPSDILVADTKVSSKMIASG